MLEPRPLQSTHMPSGLLNENDCGDSSGNPTPQLGQARDSLYARSRVSPSTATSTEPPPAFTAASTESVSRARSPASMLTRSITISMVCFFFLSSAVTSSRRWTRPLMRTRENPALRASSNTSRNSPLRFSAFCAISVARVLGGSVSSSSTISAAERAVTSPPHRWQRCSPARAYSTRR